MPLGLGNNLSSTGMVTPGIVTDNLVLKHKYDEGSVVPISDGAAFFDGTDDYITIGEHAAHAVTSLTVMAWAKVNGTPAEGYTRIVDRDDTTNDASRGYHIRYDKDALKWVGVVGNGSAKDALLSSAYSSHPQEWTHIALTYNSSDQVCHLYVDGVLVDSGDLGSGSANLNDSEVPLYIGRGQGTSNDFDGYICNAGIFSAALTQAQIKSIMNKNYAGLTSSEKTNLVSWWNLDTAYDIDDTTEGTETTQYVFDNHHGGGDTLGSDVMLDGGMSSDSGWNFTTGWSVSDGKLRRDTTDSFNSAYRATSGLTEGSLYKVTVDVATTNGNPLLVYLGENHSGSLTDNIRGRTQTAGTNVFYLVAGANNNIFFYSGSGGTRWSGTIDNVVIQEVNGNHGVLG
tara:strand:- start:385 stop:1581 length:1197 start_codon:yes stop_codon:yes gene_type:complete